MHRETEISKISLLVNLEKTNMNPLHTYTIHISQSFNIPNFLLTPKSPFSCWGLILALSLADLIGLSDVVGNLLLGYWVQHCW